MLDAQEFSDGPARLSRLAIWPGTPSFAPIPGGRTNDNYRVEAGGRLYFARIGQDLPHHHVRRTNEVRSHGLAAAAGVAPPIVHAGDGILVTEFVQGRTLTHTEPIGDAELLLAADALRKVHDYPAPSTINAFNLVDICRRNLADLPESALGGQRRRLIESILYAAPPLRPRCLIHADLIPENFIVAGNRSYIVDWEYAGYGDPAVDLAQVIVLFPLDPRQAELFVQRHGGVAIAAARALGPAVAVRELLWCEIQAHFVGVRGDLAEYRGLCWRRLEQPWS